MLSIFKRKVKYMYEIINLKPAEFFKGLAQLPFLELSTLFYFCDIKLII